MTVTRTWYIEVNSIPYATHAWEIPDLSSVLDDAPLIGSDRKIPQGPTVPYPKFPDTQIMTFPLDVFDVDEDGNPYEDKFEGLNINMAYLKANSGYASQVGDGTVPLVFHRGEIDSQTVDVHHLGFKGTATMGTDKGDRHLRTTFDIAIPAGFVFETVGS